MDKEPAMRDPQTKAIELEERLIDFAVRIIRLTAHLPQTPAGKHVAGQILRSGTSPAPNYGEARGAESHADFVHKIGIVLKELNETSIWLRVIDRSEMLKQGTADRNHRGKQRTVPDIYGVSHHRSR
jgi:four helix bundle protein